MDDACTPPRKGDDDRKPVYVVRAPDPNARGRWITLGSAWKLKDGKDGYSIRLHSVPVGSNWDGALVLFPPSKEDGT